MTRAALALSAVTLGMIALAVCMAALAWSIPAPYTPDPRLDLLYGEVIDDLTRELERGRVALAAWEDALVRAREAGPTQYAMTTN